MDRLEITNAVEAMIFAAGAPLALIDLKKAFERALAETAEEERTRILGEVKDALADLVTRWTDPDNQRGFQLVEVAEGFTFRSNGRYSDLLCAMREQRPVRLSKAALETLAIIAYRQPVTKPDVDMIRGVDSGGTLHLLLERSLVRIVGKKQEPGLPLLYGTTKEFLSFFSLANLAQLPTLREYTELSTESQEELGSFDSQTSLKDLSESAQKLRLGEEAAVIELDDAVKNLNTTESNTRASLAAEGIVEPVDAEGHEIPPPVETPDDTVAAPDKDTDKPA